MKFRRTHSCEHITFFKDLALSPFTTRWFADLVPVSRCRVRKDLRVQLPQGRQAPDTRLRGLGLSRQAALPGDSHPSHRHCPNWSLLLRM